MAGSLRRTFASLRVRNFRLFLAGQLVSGVGTWMQWVASPLLVLHLTHSGTALGFDTALTFLPILLFGAWGGVLADRFDNRKLQILTQAGYGLVAFALWLLVVTGVVEVWMVFTLSFVSGLVSAVDMPTRQSFYLELVGAEELTNAMSLNTATFTGTRIIGAAVAGAVIAAFGLAPAFLVNAISYLFVIAALVAMRPTELVPRHRVAKAKGQIREGIRYVWREKELRIPLLVMLFVFTFAFNFTVLLPLLAERTFSGDAGTYGVMLSLFGVGSLSGALFMAGRSSRPAIARLVGLGVALGVLGILVAIAPTLLVANLLIVPLGAVGIAFAITGNSTLQLLSSPELRGRVMALYTVVFLGSTPIGGTIAGWVGQHLGPRVGLAGGGVIAIAAGLAAVPSLKELRTAAPDTLKDEAPAREADPLSA
ncbi:MAG: MFS transporter [Actinomycetota bacterium]